MKLNTKKHYYIIFLIASLIIASLILIFISKDIYPYKLVIDKTPLNVPPGKETIFFDLDFDGYSDRINIHREEKAKNDYLQIYYSNGEFADQINLYSYTDKFWIYTEDWNNDKVKDIFAFSELNDSIFITVFDVSKRTYLLNREFVLAKPDSANKEIWDLVIYPIGLSEIDNNEILFAISSGYAIYPRGVFSFNLKNKKISYSFEGSASFLDVSWKDINDDGLKEIILATNATGNTPENVKYTDQRKWLFVFDQKLDFLFEPLSFGSYPGLSKCLAVLRSNGQYDLFYAHGINTNKGYKRDLERISLSGEILSNDKDLKYLKSKGSNLGLIKDNIFYGVEYQSHIFKYDSNTKESKIKQLKLYNNTSLGFIGVYNFLDVGNTILLNSIDDIYLINENLEILTYYKLPYAVPANHRWFILKLNGKNRPQLIVYDQNSNSLILNLEEDRTYSNLSLIFIFSTLILFFTFVLIHRIQIFISTYIKYFTHSINKTQNAVAILNNNAGIFYSNNNFKIFLNKKKENNNRNLFSKQSVSMSPLFPSVKKALDEKQIIEEGLNISTTDFQFEGKIRITPFTSFLGFTYAYLLEISDYTEPLLTDRGRVWGATLQRIAHEIKTPLSTIILSLDNVRYKIGTKDKSINEEIHRMQGELERIKELTKNFMLFANIEKNKQSIISLNDVLNTSKNKFISYTNNNIRLTLPKHDYNIIGDFNQLLQMFSLCIENSIDACNGNGTIKIKSELDGNDFIKVTISDDGIGMDRETLQKVFEPYYSTKKDGTGMGLSLVKKIIEDHYGKIEIKSALNLGTDITIHLKKAS